MNCVQIRAHMQVTICWEVLLKILLAVELSVRMRMDDKKWLSRLDKERKVILENLYTWKFSLASEKYTSCNDSSSLANTVCN